MQIQLLGDQASASRYVGLAKKYARKILKRKARIASKSLYPEAGVQIQIRKTGERLKVWIKAGVRVGGYEILLLTDWNHSFAEQRSEIFHSIHRSDGDSFAHLDENLKDLDPQEESADSLSRYLYYHFRDNQGQPLQRTFISPIQTHYINAQPSDPYHAGIVTSVSSMRRYYDTGYQRGYFGFREYASFGVAKATDVTGRSEFPYFTTDFNTGITVKQGIFGIIGSAAGYDGLFQVQFDQSLKRNVTLSGMPFWIQGQRQTDWYWNRDGTKCVSLQFGQRTEQGNTITTSGLVEGEIKALLNTVSIPPTIVIEEARVTASRFGRYIAADWRWFDDERRIAGTLRYIEITAYISRDLRQGTSESSDGDQSIRDLVIFADWYNDGEAAPYRRRLMLHVPFIERTLVGETAEDQLFSYSKGSRAFEAEFGYAFYEAIFSGLDLRADGYAMYAQKAPPKLTDPASEPVWRSEYGCWGDQVAVTEGVEEPEFLLGQYEEFTELHPLWTNENIGIPTNLETDGRLPFEFLLTGVRVQSRDNGTSDPRTGSPVDGTFNDYWGGLWVHPNKSWSVYGYARKMYYASLTGRNYDGVSGDIFEFTVPVEFIQDFVQFKNGEQTTHLELINEAREKTYTHDTLPILAAAATWGV